ncbi:MAG: nitronate monooxygenase [Hyphomicrobiaceae bacterium]
MQTRFTRALGLTHPIVQAPIGATPRLAAAVANAGGLGMLAISWSPAGSLGAMIAETRGRTLGAFGVNLVLRWNQQERLDAALAAGIKTVSFFWGDPSPYIDRCKAVGATTLMTVGSAAEARRAVDQGIDIVVAQGVEAGGHVWGTVGSIALVPAVRDAVGDRVPVVAAGGFADGRGLAAALCLGADGVWLGTRFVAAEEADTHPRYRQAVVEATETETLHSTLFDLEWPNAPHRALVNSTVRGWRAAGQPGLRPGEGEVIAHQPDGREIMRYSDEPPHLAHTGDMEAMCLYAGQSVGLVGLVEPAGRIVERIATEAEAILGRRDSN